VGQVAHPGGIDPPVVEIEQGAHRDRIVHGLLAPASREDQFDVLRLQPGRFLVDPFQKCEQGFVAIGNRRGPIVLQDRLDQIVIPEQLRRDRGVGPDSEWAVVAS
jgi:hypothetical protein